MSLFNKKTNEVKVESTSNVAVAQQGSIVIIGDRAFRTEVYGMVEVPFKSLEEQAAEEEARKAAEQAEQAE